MDAVARMLIALAITFTRSFVVASPFAGSCEISILYRGTQLSTKSCSKCQWQCLTDPLCTYYKFDGGDLLTKAELVTVTDCGDGYYTKRLTGLCVLYDGGGRILDVKEQACHECTQQCLYHGPCRGVFYNGEQRDKSQLNLLCAEGGAIPSTWQPGLGQTPSEQSSIGQPSSLVYPPVPPGCTPQSSMRECAKSKPELSVFAQAIKGLEGNNQLEVLSKPDFVGTVFAPTDDAFNAFANDKDITINELLADHELLSKILSLHASPGRAGDQEGLTVPLKSSEAESSKFAIYLETLNQMDELEVSYKSGMRVIPTKSDMRLPRNVLDADNDAGRSVLHVIDGILTTEGLDPTPPAPPTAGATYNTQPTFTVGAVPVTQCQSVIAYAATRNDTTMFVEAVKAAGLEDTLSNPEYAATVFIPNDEALNKAADLFGYRGMQELLSNSGAIQQLVHLHVSPGNAGNNIADPLTSSEVATDGTPVRLTTLDNSTDLAVLRDKENMYVGTVQGDAFDPKLSVLVLEADIISCGVAAHIIKAVLNTNATSATTTTTTTTQTSYTASSLPYSSAMSTPSSADDSKPSFTPADTSLSVPPSFASTVPSTAMDSLPPPTHIADSLPTTPYSSASMSSSSSDSIDPSSTPNINLEVYQPGDTVEYSLTGGSTAG